MIQDKLKKEYEINSYLANHYENTKKLIIENEEITAVLISTQVDNKYYTKLKIKIGEKEINMKATSKKEYEKEYTNEEEKYTATIRIMEFEKNLKNEKNNNI